MIDVSSETIISLAECARRLPARRAGKRPHVSCIYRWTVSGCRGIILESIQIGATRCTSTAALAKFFAALTAQARGEPMAPPPAKHRRQAIQAAEKRLAAAGI